MNWLSKLDELVTNLLPEEDRNYAEGHGGNGILQIDPLLDMDLNYGAELNDSEEVEESGLHDSTNNNTHRDCTQPPEITQSQTEDSIGELDALTEGPSSLSESSPNSYTANTILEPIAPETSILNSNVASTIRSEQPTGDVTTESRHQRDDQLEPPQSWPAVVTPPDEHNSVVLASSTPCIEQPAVPEPCSHESMALITTELTVQTQATEPISTPLTEFKETDAFSTDSGDQPCAVIRQSHETRSQPFVSTLVDPMLQTPLAGLSQLESPFFVTPATFSEPQTEMKAMRRTELPVFRTPATAHSSDDDATPSSHDLRLMRVETTSSCRLSALETTDISPMTKPPSDIDITEQNMPEFDVEFPLPEWNSSQVMFHPSMNCFGVVHLRALAAQRLPCPVGSTVQLAVSLLPWNGKVRGDSAVCFGQNSVCVKWDSLNETSGCSMVHPWNNEDTPVPIIKMELLFKPIKMLEFSICSLQLSCMPLMTMPGVWKRQWCRATIPSAMQQNESMIDDRTPLILVEAAFFPASTVDDDNPDDACSTFENPTFGAQSLRMDDGSSLRSAYHLHVKSKVHLLKLQSFWRPARCSVCKQSLIGWKRAFRCEACNIDCCADCQLQIDLQIPCGSLLAKNAVENSIQSKMTMERVLKTIAPVEEKFEQQSSVSWNDNATRLVGSPTDKGGIGRVRIRVHRASLFQTPLPLETPPVTVFDEANATNLRYGDYYVRVSCLGSANFKRTRTIQNTARPTFDSPPMVFDVPHYGMEYRVDVIDACSNNTVGTVLLTAQSLLQLQRDQRIEQDGIDAFLPRLYKDGPAKPTQMKMELRTGFKEGFGMDYFVPTKARGSKRNGNKPGSISGWIAFDVSIDEDCEGLYGQTPLKCPARPTNKLDLDILQNHVNRVIAIVEDIKKVFGVLSHVLSWKNPHLTGASLVGFVRLCYKFDAEYIGSLPVIFLLFVMLYLAVSRKAGRLKHRFIQREMESRAKIDAVSSIDHSLHRPIGYLQVSIKKGRNLRSRDLGLLGSVGCHVFWHPLRYCEDDDSAKLLSSTDKILMAHHDIGDTNYLYTANPDWDILKESTDWKRLRYITYPENSDVVHDDETFVGDYIEFPMLQPIKYDDGEVENSSERDAGMSLAPWTDLPGAIVIQVRFADVINRLPGFEDVLGEVTIPVAKIIEKGAYRGWFQIVEVGSKHIVRCDENDGSETPRLLLELKWKQPPSSNHDLSHVDREKSMMVAEEMARAAQKNARNNLNIIGSSIGALNTVRGLGEGVQSIQNALGSVVDVLEKLRNLLNFTEPGISSLVLCVLLCLCTFLALIPTRAIVVVCGIACYAVTFLARFGHPASSENQLTKSSETNLEIHQKHKENPIAIWLANAFHSIPTDDDLRKAYFWDCARISEAESSRLATERRASRLERMWNAKWFSSVNVRVVNGKKSTPSSYEWHWENRFAVVHGRRLLIWASASDFDDGENPLAWVHLAGHAGLAGLSPLEMRELPRDELPRVVNVFGRGATGQLKLMMLVPSLATKEALEEAVISAAVKGD